MRAREFIIEGGWDTTKTQSTILKPSIVKTALTVVDKFVSDFNQYLQQQGLEPVARGTPTGSSAYYQQDSVDNPDKVYGDIDLQMIAPALDKQSYSQFTAYWNKLADEFVKQAAPEYVDTSESKPGHPIFQVGPDQYVQVDFMWHTPTLAKWGAARVTPERGVKGMLMGNMFSVLGELLDMSIQHAGVQYKSVNGEHVPFSKQKGTTINTISVDPERFVLDIFKHLFKRMGIADKPKISNLLKVNAGSKVENIKISTMVNAVKGLAETFELNNMYGQGILANFSNAQDFLDKFIARYTEKAMIDINGKKREKATTPDAIARAEADKEAILNGLEKVKGMFQ